jgi:hypothetical protein
MVIQVGHLTDEVQATDEPFNLQATAATDGHPKCLTNATRHSHSTAFLMDLGNKLRYIACLLWQGMLGRE